jgi:hypothetical protein
MTSGSMLITNYLNELTTLVVIDNKASSVPPDNALNDARAALNRERSSRSPNSGNIAFLKEWLSLFTQQEKEVFESKVNADQMELFKDQEVLSKEVLSKEN